VALAVRFLEHCIGRGYNAMVMTTSVHILPTHCFIMTYVVFNSIESEALFKLNINLNFI